MQLSDEEWKVEVLKLLREISAKLDANQSTMYAKS
jgi:hypothetical protein